MRDEIAIRKMIDHAERVIAYCEGYSYEEFLADTRTIEASVFNISQIGELAHLLEKNVRQTISQRAMARYVWRALPDHPRL